MEQLKSEIEKFIFPSYSMYEDIKLDYNSKEIIVSLRKDSEYIFFMNIGTDLNYATILSYSISLNMRGKGFGSKLFDIFEKSLKRHGYPEIRLHLVATGAEKFWTKKGFKKINHIWRKRI